MKDKLDKYREMVIDVMNNVEDTATHEYRDYKWCWKELRRRMGGCERL